MHNLETDNFSKDISRWLKEIPYRIIEVTIPSRIKINYFNESFLKLPTTNVHIFL